MVLSKAICKYVVVVYIGIREGLITVRVEIPLTLLFALCTFSYYLIALSSLDMMAYA